MGKKHQEATRVRVFRVPSYSIIFNNLIYLNGVKSPANVSFSIATAGLCCHTSQILTIWPHYGINSDSKRWSDVRGCPQVHLLSRAHPSSSFVTDLPVPSHPERSHGFNSKEKDVKIKRYLNSKAFGPPASFMKSWTPVWKRLTYNTWTSPAMGRCSTQTSMIIKVPKTTSKSTEIHQWSESPGNMGNKKSLPTSSGSSSWNIDCRARGLTGLDSVPIGSRPIQLLSCQGWSIAKAACTIWMIRSLDHDVVSSYEIIIWVLHSWCDSILSYNCIRDPRLIAIECIQILKDTKACLCQRYWLWKAKDWIFQFSAMHIKCNWKTTQLQMSWIDGPNCSFLTGRTSVSLETNRTTANRNTLTARQHQKRQWSTTSQTWWGELCHQIHWAWHTSVSSIAKSSSDRRKQQFQNAEWFWLQDSIEQLHGSAKRLYRR